MQYYKQLDFQAKRSGYPEMAAYLEGPVFPVAQTCLVYQRRLDQVDLAGPQQGLLAALEGFGNTSV